METNPFNTSPQEEEPKPILGLEFAKRLLQVLEKYQDKRVLVLAPSASGKSTTVEALQTLGIKAQDMDKVLFPASSRGEKDFTMKSRPPVDPETGAYMPDVPGEKVKRSQIAYDTENPAAMETWHQGNLALSYYLNERVKVEPGKPLFSTTMINDVDVVIRLSISPELQKKRIDARSGNRPQQPKVVQMIQDSIDVSFEEAKARGLETLELEVTE